MHRHIGQQDRRMGRHMDQSDRQMGDVWARKLDRWKGASAKRVSEADGLVR